MCGFLRLISNCLIIRGFSIARESMGDEEKQLQNGQYLSIGIALGVIIGVVMDNIPMGLCIGVGIGGAVTLSKQKKNKDK